MRILAIITGVFLAAIVTFADFADTFPPSPADPAIDYYGPSVDPVAKLAARLAAGSAKLAYTSRGGYLKSLLEALNVPVESQIVVQTRTSLQAALISPTNPRSIFFNDSVAVGWMYGGFIEIAAQDPKRGTIFYKLAQDPGRPPRFDRDNACLACHRSDTSLGTPGPIVRSVRPGADGEPLVIYGADAIDHRTPIEQRWGGWYVTGAPGGIRHMGNLRVTDRDQPEVVNSIPVRSLEAEFPVDRYLSPYSDAAALMVFDHQMYATGLITRYGWDVRTKPASIEDGAKEVAAYLMFTGEAKLTVRFPAGSGFAAKFSAQGPRDSKGRSLRQLNLDTRLFEFPCSYMVYSDAFQALPDAAKNAVYKRLLAELPTKGDPGIAAAEILRGTLRLP